MMVPRPKTRTGHRQLVSHILAACLLGCASRSSFASPLSPKQESDPAVLNLTDFESFFDEKRPFFIEGMQIYEFSVGPGELLYTRRIGAGSPIIGATKLSGRTEKGTSFGLLGHHG